MILTVRDLALLSLALALLFAALAFLFLALTRFLMFITGFELIKELGKHFAQVMHLEIGTSLGQAQLFFLGADFIVGVGILAASSIGFDIASKGWSARLGLSASWALFVFVTTVVGALGCISLLVYGDKQHLVEPSPPLSVSDVEAEP